MAAGAPGVGGGRGRFDDLGRRLRRLRRLELDTAIRAARDEHRNCGDDDEHRDDEDNRPGVHLTNL